MIRADGTPEVDRAIIDLTHGSRTPAWIEKNGDDVRQLTLGTLAGSVWINPGDLIVQTAPGVFDVVRG